MRWKTYGDITRIRTAVFYKRYRVPENLFDTIISDTGEVTYIPSPFLRKPYKHSVTVRSNKSDLSSFMEYNFKYKVDKGLLSSYTIQNYLNNYTNDLLVFDKDENISNDNTAMLLPERSLVFQLGGTSIDRKYDYFSMIPMSTFSEIILDIEGDEIIREDDGNFSTINIPDGVYVDGIEQYSTILEKSYGPGKIEFYDEMILDISGINHEYIEELYKEGDRKPVLVVEFGPEISHEREDYMYKRQMPEGQVPSSERLDYISMLDEFSNRKFLYITITSDEKLESINLSLDTHVKDVDPHRNQDKVVLRNDEWDLSLYDKSLINEFNNDNIDDSNEVLLFDKRSNTLLGTVIQDKSSFIILNDKLLRGSTKTLVEYGKLKSTGEIVRVTEENRPNISEIVESFYAPDYKRYIVYKEGDRVMYNGIDYKSIVNGNLSEDPQISPFWETYSPVESNIPPTPDRVLMFIRNISDDVSSNNTSTPTGEQYVIKGNDFVIRCLPAYGYHVYKATLNGLDIQVINNVINIKNVTTGPNNILIYYRKVQYRLTLNIKPSGVSGLIVSGAGDYSYNYNPTLLATTTNINYQFDNWIDEDGNIISSKPEEKDWRITRDTELTANFTLKLAKITVSTENGGIPDFSSKYVNYGSKLNVTFSILPGYEFDYLMDNGNKIYLTKTSEVYVLDNINKDHDIVLYFCRPKESESDPDLGDIEYVTIGDYDWTIKNLEYDKGGTSPLEYSKVNGFGKYYQGFDIDRINKIITTPTKDYPVKSGFHIPTDNEWKYLINYFGGDKMSGRSLKSSNIYDPKKDLIGWRESDFSGRGEFRFNAYPSGTVNIYGDINDFIDVNENTFFWSSSLDSVTESYPAVKFMYDNYTSEIINNKIRGRAFPIRLCRKTLSQTILGDSYKYKKFGNQYWITSSLVYDELGSYFDDLSLGVDSESGRLYSFEEMEIINNLLKSEGHGFHIPTDNEWKDLEKFLGLIDPVVLDQSNYRGTTEGKRLKRDNKSYNNTYWNGYNTDDPNNTSFKAIPDGYYEHLIGYRDLGSISRYWTSTTKDIDNTKAYSRSIKSDTSKLGRFLDDKRNKLLIRLVKTK